MTGKDLWNYFFSNKKDRAEYQIEIKTNEYKSSRCFHESISAGHKDQLKTNKFFPMKMTCFAVTAPTTEKSEEASCQSVRLKGNYSTISNVY